MSCVEKQALPSDHAFALQKPQNPRKGCFADVQMRAGFATRVAEPSDGEETSVPLKARICEFNALRDL